MESEYIFEWWHVPVVILVFIAGVWLSIKVWGSYKNRHYNGSYKSRK